MLDRTGDEVRWPSPARRLNSCNASGVVTPRSCSSLRKRSPVAALMPLTPPRSSERAGDNRCRRFHLRLLSKILLVAAEQLVASVA